jgi:predicted PurR-regulated permease PerM
MSTPEPSHRQSSQVTIKTVFTVCFTVLAVTALVYFLLRTTVSLVLTIGAVMVAIALNHAVEVLTRRGLRRSLAIAAVVVGVLAVGVGLGFLLIPPVISQGRALVAEAPSLWQQLQQTRLFQSLNERFDVQEQLRQGSQAATGAINPVLSAIGGALSVLGGLVTLLFLTVFVLVFGPDIKNAVMAEFSPDSRERYERIVANIYRSVGGYLQGLLGICTINVILTTIFLAIVRMPFFLPLGIMSGTSSLIPYAGPLVAGALITVLALITGGLWKALAAAIYFVLYGQLEGNILGPLVYRRTAHVNPLVTLLAILFLAEFMGIAGAVIAVPIAAAAQIVVREVLTLRRERLALGAAGARVPPAPGPVQGKP